MFREGTERKVAKMRIGRLVIDTDDMTVDELTTIIVEFRQIRARKMRKEELQEKMNSLISEAQEDGFLFIDNTCGFVREPNDFDIMDERA